ncbi:polysaccharide biosynthesis/export family protein [Flavobacterium humi]|uniref:Sugar transporter n=1 Tax=Flavobacterium humi TaxID=2562683 RepID=A0A4Z0L4H5_9FLAO|nr:polysaccharide biosynthesis/export family protein [Flavobacterium humi]TGD57127.1 sugar transporter [Flavobacterium humi]
MNKIYSFLGVVFLFLITSCVSNKELVYLQKTNDSGQQSAVEPINLKPYRVQVNDILTIKIKALDQKLVEMFNTSQGNAAQAVTQDKLYFDGFSVDDHGNIRVPVLGEVAVIGLTLDEIRIKIEKQLLDQYFNKEADIFVSVKLAGMRFTVNGEISSPGTKTLYQDKVTILEAIANSGDITIVGNRKDVMVIRQYPHGTEMHSLDLTNADVMKSPYYYIQPNDFIYVKPLKQKTWGFGVNGLQSFTTILSAFTLLVTTYFLIKK